ncbi:MAG: hypothetical protein H0X35_14245 [Pseudonocardiales bacterium]|nr:hypothetical protein [Pseudonocardiales bacterium]
MSELPANLETVLPLVQVVRSGGAVNVALVQDRPRLDIDVYAADRGTAKDLARQIQGLLPTMRNVTTGGAVVGDVAEESGPSYRPDYNPNVRRIGMTYRCTLRPA